jgi:hypothetical protein
MKQLALKFPRDEAGVALVDGGGMTVDVDRAAGRDGLAALGAVHIAEYNRRATEGATMRATTIHGLWAWAIVNGHKRVENCSWPVNYRGDLWIHGAAQGIGPAGPRGLGVAGGRLPVAPGAGSVTRPRDRRLPAGCL